MALSESAKLAIKISAENTTDRAFNQLGSQLGRLKTAALALGGALASGLAMKNVLDSTRQWSREIDSLQDTLGVAAGEAAALNYVGRSVGLTTEDMANAFGILSKRLSDQAEQLAQGVSDFDKWGIGVRDAGGNMLSFSEILGNTRTRLQALGPGMAARAAEMDLFGKAGGKLHDMLFLTGEQVTQLEEEMRALGLGTTDQAVGAMEQFERNMSRAGLAVDALKISLGNALVPALDEALRAFIGFVKEAMPTIRDVVLPLVRGFLNLAAAVLDFGRAMARAAGALASAIFGVRRMDGFTKSLSETLRRITGFVKSLTDAFDRFAAAVGKNGLLAALTELAGEIKDKVLEALGEIGTKLDSLGPAGTIAKAALLALGAATVLNAIGSAVTAIGNVGAALRKLPAKTLLLLDVVLVGVAIDEVAKTAKLVGDNWELSRQSVHDGSIDMQDSSNSAGAAFIKAAVGWGNIFEALGTTTRMRLDEWGVIFDGFGTKVREVYDSISTKIGSTFEALGTTTQTRIDEWGVIFDGFGTNVRGVFDTIGSTTETRLAEWGQFFDDFGTKVREVYDDASKTAGSFFDGLGTQADELFRPGGTIGTAFSQIGTRLREAIENIDIDFGWIRISGRNGITFNIPPLNLNLGGSTGRPAGGGAGGGGGGGATNMADGGIVRARPGGTLIRAGEGGRDEAIIPLPARGGGGTTVVVNLHVAGSVLSERELLRTVQEGLIRDLRHTRQLT